MNMALVHSELTNGNYSIQQDDIECLNEEKMAIQKQKLN